MGRATIPNLTGYEGLAARVGAKSVDELNDPRHVTTAKVQSLYDELASKPGSANVPTKKNYATMCQYCKDALAQARGVCVFPSPHRTHSRAAAAQVDAAGDAEEQEAAHGGDDEGAAAYGGDGEADAAIEAAAKLIAGEPCESAPDCDARAMIRASNKVDEQLVALLDDIQRETTSPEQYTTLRDGLSAMYGSDLIDGFLGHQQAKAVDLLKHVLLELNCRGMECMSVPPTVSDEVGTAYIRLATLRDQRSLLEHVKSGSYQKNVCERHQRQFLHMLTKTGSDFFADELVSTEEIMEHLSHPKEPPSRKVLLRFAKSLTPQDLDAYLTAVGSPDEMYRQHALGMDPQRAGRKATGVDGGVQTGELRKAASAISSIFLGLDIKEPFRYDDVDQTHGQGNIRLHATIERLLNSHQKRQLRAGITVTKNLPIYLADFVEFTEHLVTERVQATTALLEGLAPLDVHGEGGDGQAARDILSTWLKRLLYPTYQYQQLTSVRACVGRGGEGMTNLRHGELHATTHGIEEQGVITKSRQMGVPYDESIRLGHSAAGPHCGAHAAAPLPAPRVPNDMVAYLKTLLVADTAYLRLPKAQRGACYADAYMDADLLNNVAYNLHAHLAWSAARIFTTSRPANGLFAPRFTLQKGGANGVFGSNYIYSFTEQAVTKDVAALTTSMLRAWMKMVHQGEGDVLRRQTPYGEESFKINRVVSHGLKSGALIEAGIRGHSIPVLKHIGTHMGIAEVFLYQTKQLVDMEPVVQSLFTPSPSATGYSISNATQVSGQLEALEHKMNKIIQLQASTQRATLALLPPLAQMAERLTEQLSTSCPNIDTRALANGFSDLSGTLNLLAAAGASDGGVASSLNLLAAAGASDGGVASSGAALSFGAGETQPGSDMMQQQHPSGSMALMLAPPAAAASSASCSLAEPMTVQAHTPMNSDAIMAGLTALLHQQGGPQHAMHATVPAAQFNAPPTHSYQSAAYQPPTGTSAEQSQCTDVSIPQATKGGFSLACCHMSKASGATTATANMKMHKSRANGVARRTLENPPSNSDNALRKPTHTTTLGFKFWLATSGAPFCAKPGGCRREYDATPAATGCNQAKQRDCKRKSDCSCIADINNYNKKQKAQDKLPDNVIQYLAEVKACTC